MNLAERAVLDQLLGSTVRVVVLTLVNVREPNIEINITHIVDRKERGT